MIKKKNNNDNHFIKRKLLNENVENNKKSKVGSDNDIDHLSIEELEQLILLKKVPRNSTPLLFHPLQHLIAYAGPPYRYTIQI